MSSEQRMKKLRGSGGYVMATVNDDQQRKGNLGGPDLFLAPIGRLDSEKISRYFCNTCEKDYDGSPKIDYENPNEEVADNLILAERGQYVCATCSSTIAEYREFTKPNEQSEVGLARPEEQIFEAPEPAFSEPAPAAEPPAQFDSFDQPTDYAQTLEPADSVSPIVGISVFDENGVKVGVSKQVGVDSTKNVVLVVTKNDGSDAIIKWDQIKKIGEIILLGDKSDSAQAAGSGCSGCGFENKAGSKFCEQCGSKL